MEEADAQLSIWAGSSWAQEYRGRPLAARRGRAGDGPDRNGKDASSCNMTESSAEHLILTTRSIGI